MSIQSDTSDLTKNNSLKVRFSQATEWCLALLSAIGSMAVLIWLLFYSSYGFEFTDEGFYLNWVAAPKLYDSSLTQFGYIYYPLNLLVGGDVAWLRRANVLLTFFLSWFLVDTIIKGLFPSDIKSKVNRYVVSFGFASGGVSFFSFWLLSPSYNSLNFQALLIIAAGLCLIELEKERSFGWVLIAVGGWLAFMAKPSSAALVGVCVFFCLLITRKINIRMMLLSAMLLVFLLILSSLIIDGSISGFILRLQTAMTFAEFLGGGHTLVQLLRFDDFLLSSEEVTNFRVVLIACLVVPFFLYVNNFLTRTLGLLLSGVLLLVIILLITGKCHLSLKPSSFQGLLILVVPTAMLLLSCFFFSRRFISKFSLSHIFMALSFAVFPHIYAFGSNNNYWAVGSLVGFFWLVAGLVLFVPSLRGEKSSFILFPLVLFTQVVVVILVHSGMTLPYRQPQPLVLNVQPVELGRSGSRLWLSEGYANYLTDAITTARKAGFHSGTPIIDLSGQSPGLLYALGANSIGRAWMIGGYPGSFKLATEVLKRVPCEQLISAWLLVEPGGPRSISDSLIGTFGADLKDYEVVASWNTPKGAGGFEERPIQQLLKPNYSIDLSADKCAQTRAH
ncbi:hypothetical protein HNO86_18230 [Pseudomonas sp. C1C7]|uniref:hypothetical protein n=1 Tax=Pseudomonas sp. C1C7 TaxID=2735272 RepID=UPI00158640F5|nr:hypothetical protein [Pseudomonas sp. C1C7]NUT76980.1 hypothetical protein [Pseudomonas sp. C1C7]